MPDPEKLLNAPPLTVMSPTAKLPVASLDLNVREIVKFLDVSPSLTSADVIAIVGAVVSNQAAVGVVFQLLVVLNWLIIAAALKNISLQ